MAATILIVVLLLFMIVPGLMQMWNKPDLTSFGWPISEVAIIVDSVLMCVVLAGTNIIENYITKKEREMRERGEKIEYLLMCDKEVIEV